jgi:hypothetical protein
MRKLAISLAVVAAVAATVAYSGPASAAKSNHRGGNPKVPAGTTTISIVLLNSTDGLAHYGQNVTFNVSSNQTDQPWVHLVCSQSGAVVSEGWEGMFAGSLDDGVFGLYSPKWTGGAADCTATVTNPSWAPLASTSFHVYA